MTKKIWLLLFLVSLLGTASAASRRLNNWGFTKPPVGTPVNWGDPITSGLVFFAPMNDKGNKFTYDIARNKKGALVSAFPTWAAGKFEGPSTSYTNGSSQNIDFGNFLVAMSSFTFGCWVKSSTSAAFNICFMNLGHTGAGTGCVFQLWCQTSAANSFFRFQTRDDSGTFLNVVTTGNTSQAFWQHVVGVRKSTTLTVYVNGIQVGTGTGAQGAITPNDFTIGSTVVTGSDQEFLTGNIDLPFVYNRALSTREIRKLYEEPMCLFAPAAVSYKTIANASGLSTKVRRSIPEVGTRTGSRQVHF